MKSSLRKEYGDFQTPLGLAKEICELIRARFGGFDTIIEPTCGVGAFVAAAGAAFPDAKLVGFEINPAHLELARSTIQSHGLEQRTSLRQQDFFNADWECILRSHAGRILLLGNPPWVTNSEVSTLNGSNIPAKDNFQGHKGLAARTGKANFDISEWMLIKLLEAAKPQPLTIAMLCKTATARKVLRYAWQKDGRIARAMLHKIDATAHFGVSVDACLFIAELGASGPHEATLFNCLSTDAGQTRFGLAGHDIVPNLDTYASVKHLEGLNPYRWRSGIKHDCASVMELSQLSNGVFRNQLGEVIILEREVVYPLLKSTALFHGRLNADRWLLVPQHRVGESTSRLAVSAPHAWNYLQNHAAKFAARKSSIYQRGDPFAIFGVGDYSFAPWKVAISGLHRPPKFQVIPPLEGQPVMFDDTCYFTSVDTEQEAEVVAQILNSDVCSAFLGAVTLPEAKRPVTADLLHRINFRALASECDLVDSWDSCRTSATTSQVVASANAQIEMLLEESAVYQDALKPSGAAKK